MCCRCVLDAKDLYFSVMTIAARYWVTHLTSRTAGLAGVSGCSASPSSWWTRYSCSTRGRSSSSTSSLSSTISRWSRAPCSSTRRQDVRSAVIGYRCRRRRHRAGFPVSAATAVDRRVRWPSWPPTRRSLNDFTELSRGCWRQAETDWRRSCLKDQWPRAALLISRG